MYRISFQRWVLIVVAVCAMGWLALPVSAQVSETPTETPVETPTATPVPPTNTPVPPTATPETSVETPTATPVPPTNTPVPPTATPETSVETPTATPVPPTNTPVPPTNTPVPPTATPETGGETPTATPVPPTNTPVPPTNTPVPPTATPETGGETPTATPAPPTNTPAAPTNTPGSQPTPILIPTNTPTPSPTVVRVNPELGMLVYDVVGGSHLGGSANLAFDTGLSDAAGNLFNTRVRDGVPDPAALGPFLFLFLGNDFGFQFVPVARDVELSGEWSRNNGLNREGAYFLLAGTIGPFPPVNARLGAIGNEHGGGIDTNGNGFYGDTPSGGTIGSFGTFESDIVPINYFPETGLYDGSLIDLEPAGNNGFYVLDRSGKIFAEGSANAALEVDLGLTGGVTAVGFKVYRGELFLGNDTTPANSQYATAANLAGTGAYVLLSNGVIRVVGDAPAISTGDAPFVPQGADPLPFKDIELLPNQAGSAWAGVALLTGDGIIHGVPFTGQTLPKTFVDAIGPFNGLAFGGFGWDIARDLEVEISGKPLYGVDSTGSTVGTTGVRIGSFMTDGFGGVFAGGDSTRFAPAPVSANRATHDVPGFGPSFPFPVNSAYFFPDDVVIDMELISPPKQ